LSRKVYLQAFEGAERNVAEEYRPSGLHVVQQADHAWREGIEVLLPQLPPGSYLEMREVQEVLKKVQVCELQL
jgi:hypothetical protein